MSKIEIGRFSEQLRRMFGMAGEERVASHLSPELSATVEVQSESPDLDFLKGVRNCSVGITLAAAAGFTTFFRLRNPADSGVVTVIDKIVLQPLNGAEMAIARGLETTDLLTGTVASSVIDPRWQASGATGSTMLLSVSNGIATGVVGDNLLRVNLDIRQIHEYTKGIVLTPGSSCDWGSQTVNVLMFTYVTWFERPFPVLEQ